VYTVWNLFLWDKIETFLLWDIESNYWNISSFKILNLCLCADVMSRIYACVLMFFLTGMDLDLIILHYSVQWSCQEIQRRNINIFHSSPEFMVMQYIFRFPLLATVLIVDNH
jgi:hypothetical protein